MRIKSLLFALLFLASTHLLAQNIDNPTFKSSNDKITSILNIEVKPEFTVITFQHPGTKGAWIQVNEGMYLQDADGQTKYDLIKAENIPLVPEKYFFQNQEKLVFKLYFQKIKEGTKRINIIERALSEEQMNSTITYLNYFDVNLENTTKEW